MRFLTGDTHPDHDSICKFRRENKDLLSDSFHQVLELAARARVLQVGDITVAIDGTKILANASKHSAVSYGHAVEQMKLAGEQNPTVYAAMKRQSHGRSIAQLEVREDPPPINPPLIVAIDSRVSTCGY